MAVITEEEKLSRKLAGESVIGTSAMDGLILNAPTLELMRLFQEGEIDLDQMSAGIDRHVQSLIDARQAHRMNPPIAATASVSAA